MCAVGLVSLAAGWCGAILGFGDTEAAGLFFLVLYSHHLCSVMNAMVTTGSVPRNVPRMSAAVESSMGACGGFCVISSSAEDDMVLVDVVASVAHGHRGARRPLFSLRFTVQCLW
jgi:hypothetical protein